MKVRIKIEGNSNAMTFVVEHAPTESSSDSTKNEFSTTASHVVLQAKPGGPLFLMVDASTCTGERDGGGGERRFKVLVAYGRDDLNTNVERLVC